MIDLWVEAISEGVTTVSLTWHDVFANVAGVFDSILITAIKLEPDPSTLVVYENYDGNKWDIKDPSWNKVDPASEGRIWNHNRHLWEVDFQVGTAADAEGVVIWAVPFDYVDDIPEDTELSESPLNLMIVDLHGDKFVDASVPDGFIGKKAFYYGNPPKGDWVYVAVVEFKREGTSVFRTSKIMGKDNGLPMSEVITEFTTYTSEDMTTENPNYFAEGTHSKNTLPGSIVYPERNVPNQNATNPVWDDLGVWVTVEPAIGRPLEAPVWINIFDPDNKLNDDINDTKDINGVNEPKEGDNLDSVDYAKSPTASIGTGANLNGSLVAQKLLFRSGETTLDYEEKFLPFHIIDTQPGNNWQIAVHDEKSVLNKYNYGNTGPGFDGNGVVLRATGNGDAVEVFGYLHSQILTAVRTLWIEQDAMKSVDATIPPSLRGVFNGETGCDGCDDPIEFSKAADLTLLTELLSPILVDVKAMPNDWNVSTEATFSHYINPDSTAVGNVFGNVRDVDSKKDFWVVQTGVAYEGFPVKSNDPNEPFVNAAFEPGSWTLGYSAYRGGDGTAVIFSEEVRDVLENSDTPANTQFVANFLATVVAHEVLHKFLGWHSDGPQANEGLMDGVNALLAEPGESAIELTLSIATKNQPFSQGGW